MVGLSMIGVFFGIICFPSVLIYTGPALAYFSAPLLFIVILHVDRVFTL